MEYVTNNHMDSYHVHHHAWQRWRSQFWACLPSSTAIKTGLALCKSSPRTRTRFTAQRTRDHIKIYGFVCGYIIICCQQRHQCQGRGRGEWRGRVWLCAPAALMLSAMLADQLTCFLACSNYVPDQPWPTQWGTLRNDQSPWEERKATSYIVGNDRLFLTGTAACSWKHIAKQIQGLRTSYLLINIARTTYLMYVVQNHSFSTRHF